jgi:hypothetical protein
MALDDGPSVKWMGEETAGFGVSAKWLVAGLGATGALLIGGLQLAKLGDLHGLLHILVAVLAGVAAVAALIAAVMITVNVMLPSTVSLGGLRKRADEAVKTNSKDGLIDYIQENSDELLRTADDTLPKLEYDYRVALDKRRAAAEALRTAAFGGRLTQGHRDAANATSDEALRIALFVQRVLSGAKLYQAKEAFGKARVAVGLLALVVALGIVALTWATNAPDKPVVDLRGADLSNSSLVGVKLRGAKLDGMTIEGANLKGTYLGDASTEKTVWKRTTCPDGVFSDNAGMTCEGHLVP